jgi:hypothetical protein
MDRSEGGQVLSEYVLILLLIFIVAIVATALFGNRLVGLFMQAVAAF